MKTQPKKTFSFELTDWELKDLDSALDNILDQSSQFGVFENNLVSDMAKGYAGEEPELTKSIIETLAIITSSFLAIEKYRPILHNIMLQSMNLRIVDEQRNFKVATGKNLQS